MKIEMSGPNGETFEAEFTIDEYSSSATDWVKLTEKHNTEKMETFQKALDKWANVCIEAVKSKNT